ncbi:MAG TPA: DUF4956 domain-containing protein [Bacteroidales bacterium]|nr:DUF4956 domain-containing protein [Bacteroidales bacterium]
MNMHKLMIFAVLIALLGLCLPGYSTAQDSMVNEYENEVWEQTVVDEDTSGVVSSSEETVVEKDVKKKKNKDIVKLNSKFFYNLLIDIAAVLIIIFLIYYPSNKKLGFVFTFILFNVVIFLLTYVLNEVKISMGAAFGLFAVFSMLRYRTLGISMKDMTYLFIFIAIGLISAIQLEYYELLIINGILIFCIFILDSKLILKREASRSVLYDNLDLIQPDKREELIEDLKKRTGFNIHRVTIGKINLLKDAAVVKIYFYE